ncbi:ABC transporter substrate-binding protein [Faunimonas pinastri]|uniref:ABC transporter substrate-binding protein n=1 Tax=Faunimonas pinastri TaxID=1855383 RepID=UPI0015A668A5|nr:extracellular solute-binding protein [Faunimonas pinastri]
MAASIITLSSAASAQESSSEVWTYWGSGAEKQAIESVVALDNQKHPDTEVTHRVIPGNTLEMRRQLQTALLGGTPPTAYQSAMGYELKTFVDADQLASIDSVWKQVKGDEIFPRGLQRVVKIDGKPYAIPLNMGVISNVFYRKDVFDKLGLQPPKTIAEFDAVCDKLAAAGIAPLGNASGPFWSMYNFYAPLLSVLGPDGYFKMAQGEVSFTSPEIRKAFELYRDTFVKHYSKNWSGKTWAQGGDDLVNKDVGMYMMGDWVSAYMKERGLQPGKDYDFFPAPGIGKATLIQVDVIATPKESKTSDNFLLTAASTEAQASFNKYKGSIAANLKTDPSIYDYVGQKEVKQLQASEAENVVLPNLFFLLPTNLGSEMGNQLERFASDPSDATLDTVLKTLEALRLQDKEDDAFVNW